MRHALATYPVHGPVEIRGREHPVLPRPLGGAMHRDLRAACDAALQVHRAEARSRALDFSWSRAGDLFASFIVPARSPRASRDAEQRAWS